MLFTCSNRQAPYSRNDCMNKKITKKGAFCFGALFFSLNANAVIPASFNNSTPTDNVTALLIDTVTLAALTLCAVSFIVVVKNAIKSYSDWQDGKGTLSNVILYVIVGAGLLTLSIPLLNEANAILHLNGSVSPVNP